MIADGIDTMVLGCTHYPLLTGAIGRALGDGIKLVDSARIVRRREGIARSTITRRADE